VKIFISHSSKDAAIARALIDLLRSALLVPADELRCSSVPGNKLPPGASVEEQLKVEVLESTAFLVLLSPSSIQSVFVLFELGARWGSGHEIFPVLVGGLKAAALPAPLSAINAISGADDHDVDDLLRRVSTVLGDKLEPASAYLDNLRAFSEAAADPY
jgi:hypothetical protein